MRGVIWFRKDLRLCDNPALTQACKQSHDGIVATYVIDYEMWKKNHTSFCQIEFIHRGLAILKSDLEERGIPLIILETDKTASIPTMFSDLFNQLTIEKLFMNRELEFNEATRDQAVILKLNERKIETEILDDQFIIPYSEFHSKREEYFKVFTPFKRFWVKNFNLSDHMRLHAKPKPQKPIPIKSTNIPVLKDEFASSIDPRLWLAGEAAAKKQLRTFVQHNLSSYDESRNFPFIDRTSKLSPYLAVGMISGRQCFVAALNENNQELDSGNKGALTWMSELIWREFYRHILIAAPRICKGRAYKLKTEHLPWKNNKTLLDAWKTGNTGFPIIDAAMRQLNTTGWMHNRLRMIVAMFFSKNLFLDWRLGEKYFSESLIDIDFASNNGGWQWSASTGTDSVPYFRIFNPTTQSTRFDPDGQFIRKFCPELSHLNNKEIHDPHSKSSHKHSQLNYPPPIVDYALTRKRCLEWFKGLN